MCCPCAGSCDDHVTQQEKAEIEENLREQLQALKHEEQLKVNS